MPKTPERRGTGAGTEHAAPQRRPASGGNGDEVRRERRAYGRHRVEGVQGTFLFSTDAKVVNLSLDGLAVETSSYLQVGHDYSLRLQHAEHPMRIRGQVVWCSLVRTSRDGRGDVVPVYRAGLHFERLLSKDESDLYRFLEESAVIHLEGRVYGRVRIQPPESASVQHEAKFRLRRISQSGMGIESDFVPEVDAVVQIEMRLQRRTFRAAGRLVHMQQLSQQTVGVPRVLIGIEFQSMDEASRAVLEEFIRVQLG